MSSLNSKDLVLGLLVELHRSSSSRHQAHNEDVSDRTRCRMEAEVAPFYSQVPVVTDVIVLSERHSS